MVVVIGGPQYRVGSHRQFVQMARQLALAGHRVFRFDYRGMGDSSGEPRTFEVVEEDIKAAVDRFFGEAPSLRGVVIFGLCDAASAALMYCFHHDPRVVGLVLANPWVRTEAGEAKALVHQYYGRRLLQRSLWHKLWSGQFDIRGSLRGLFAVLRLSAIRDTIIANDPRHFTQRMLAGFEAFSGPVLLLLSGRDLTAHEFEEFTKASRGWSMRLNRPSVNRVNLPHADHTFSGKAALDEATQAVIRWLDDPQLR